MESTSLNRAKPAREKSRRHGDAHGVSARSADDLVVVTNGTQAQALAMQEARQEVLDPLGLQRSEDKTQGTHITAGCPCLGYWVMRAVGETGHMVPQGHLPDDAMQRAVHAMRRLLGPQTTGDALAATLQALHRFIRGWCQDYRCPRSPARKCRQWAEALFWDRTHWRGQQDKWRTPAVLRRFKKGESCSHAVGTGKLSKPDVSKAKKRLVKAWHNPSPGPETIARDRPFSYESL